MGDGTRQRSWWGWGWQDQAVSGADLAKIQAAVAARPGFADVQLRPAPDLASIELRPPRLSAPPPLARLCTDDREARAARTHGKSYRDVVRNFRGQLDHPPDLVAFPESEADVVAVLDWCSSANIAAIPYGGGSSVVGGTEADVGDSYVGAVSIDLSKLRRVLEVDSVSRAARIQAGAFGPDLEEQLKPHGYTLRHYPQSFEFSTLGGWLATRSGGHYATNWTHIDDFVESMRVVTPTGISESRRLPGSGAGPSPDRLFLGSEGALGIITEAWMRVQDRPTFKASATARFATLEGAAAAARAIGQAGLFPANCRLLDPGEAVNAGVADGSTLLVIGFESADHPLDPWVARAVELCADHGGSIPDGVRSSSTEGAAGAWRSSFLRAPYGRDAMVAMSVIAETFETAVTWDRLPALHDGIRSSVQTALDEICGGGSITMRFTHVYPDGAAPYFTILAPGRPGSELDQWDQIKAAAAEAIHTHGGTITHHHAVGRDHRPWYDRQRPEPFGAALAAAKAALDPSGVLNPGVLLDPR